MDQHFALQAINSELNNSLRRRNIMWSRIPPYAPSQAGSWESMVKLFRRVMGEVRRKPSLIELDFFLRCRAHSK